MCVNVKRVVPSVCLSIAPLPHGLRGSKRKTLLSQPACYVALDATALFLQTYAASSQKKSIVYKGVDWGPQEDGLV